MKIITWLLFGLSLLFAATGGAFLVIEKNLTPANSYLFFAVILFWLGNMAYLKSIE